MRFLERNMPYMHHTYGGNPSTKTAPSGTFKIAPKQCQAWKKIGYININKGKKKENNPIKVRDLAMESRFLIGSEWVRAPPKMRSGQ
jgi:hypothetical protein